MNSGNGRNMEMALVKTTIDGQEIEVQRDRWALEVAREMGISIPTLCYHPALEPYGACRLCVVEVTKGKWTWLTTACDLPIREGLSIRTDTPGVIKARKLAMELLLAQAPRSEELAALAGELGVTKTRFASRDDDNRCILCGLCVRVCHQVIGAAAIGFAGRGARRKVSTPYQDRSESCIGCGACAFVCPTGAIDPADYCPYPLEKIPNEFNCGIDSRTPVHIPFPQAVPNKPVIDRENCIRFLTGGCGACETICPADAIDYDMTDEYVQEKVGAIVVATGYELFDPGVYEEYGYGKYPDVVTSLEFERMVSASGPSSGELTRPSNGKPPKTVVFLQCIGSRRESEGLPYCSKICCMYTAKHAILYKHKVHDGQAFVFYMDVRAGGKNYEQFVRRVAKEHMATYLRGRVSKIFPRDGKLIVRGADTLSGGQVEIAAEMVVLAPAIVPSAGVRELAQKLRLGYDEHGFLMEAHPKLRPVETNTAGVFLAGACHSPKDIPESVAQASAAASKALGLVSHTSLTREPTIGVVNEASCNGCFECEGVCAYGAIEHKDILDREGNVTDVLAYINNGLCQGCGACAVTCRSKSIEVQGYRDDQLFAAINAIGR